MADTQKLLPQFDAWFRARDWQPRAHQKAFWQATQGGHDALLIAPTGGGKTLAGLCQASKSGRKRLNRQIAHFIYVAAKGPGCGYSAQSDAAGR